jgi:hypothetical protein
MDISSVKRRSAQSTLGKRMRIPILALFAWSTITMLHGAATIPDFWTRVSEVRARNPELRIVSLDARFRYGQTVAFVGLPSGWIASVQKDKEGVFSVQLAAIDKGVSASLGELLSILRICPEANKEDDDLAVEFLDADAWLLDAGAHGDLQPVKITSSEVRVMSVKKPVAAKKSNQMPELTPGGVAHR